MGSSTAIGAQNHVLVIGQENIKDRDVRLLDSNSSENCVSVEEVKVSVFSSLRLEVLPEWLLASWVGIEVEHRDGTIVVHACKFITLT